MQIHGDAVRLGVHAAPQHPSFEAYRAVWERAESLGLDWVSTFDHFRPPDGGPSGPCLEGPTALAALAACTSRVRCALLVAAVSNRHPAALAAIAATIDHVSGGRLELGIGAGGPDLAQTQYGLPYPSLRTRLSMLDEACVVLRKLWTEDVVSFAGKYVRLQEAALEPKPVQSRLPLVIGGAGERRLLRIVAEHADIWNTFVGDLDLYRSRLDALAAHCRELGRDAADIRKSVLFRAVLAESHREAVSRGRESLRGEAADSPAARMTFVGTPEQCAEHLRTYARLGVGDFLLGVRVPPDLQTLELFARHVAPALRA